MVLLFMVLLTLASAQGVQCANLTCPDCKKNGCGWCAGSEQCISPVVVNVTGCSGGSLAFGGSIDCYGCQDDFFPCSSNLSSSILLILLYGVVIVAAAKVTSMGAEKMLELFPGSASVIGALLLPVLGSFPDACMIVASGALGTVAEAQEQLNVGIGALAGSATFFW